jgi:hypothetical protein
LSLANHILMCGDSFGADQDCETLSWIDMLRNDHNITNVCQAGVSEYKILLQVNKHLTSDFDAVIICHTSQYRVHTIKHPVHKDGPHKDSDLIYGDIEYHNSKKHTPSLTAALGYFAHHFDPEYYQNIYDLLRYQILRSIPQPAIHVDFFSGNSGLDLSDLPKSYPGQPNHMSESGHKLAYEKISKEISNLELDI